MKAIQIFLEELTKKSTMTASLVTELKNNKNTVLAINNTLFKYKINKKIKPKEIVKISPEDISQIYKEMGYENFKEKENIFKEKIEIINLYKNITTNHGEIGKAPQYNAAMLEMEKFCEEINSYLDKHKEEQENHISSLENVISSYEFYLKKFKGSELSDPIFDMLEFNSVLDKCGFDIDTKWKIKKEIGKSNYNIVKNKGITFLENAKALDKYRVIIERKKQEYGPKLEELLNTISGNKINISNMKEEANKISEKENLDYNLVNSALTVLLLKKEIDKYDELLKTKKQIDEEKTNAFVIMCEQILVLSREKEETKKEEKEIKPVSIHLELVKRIRAESNPNIGEIKKEDYAEEEIVDVKEEALTPGARIREIFPAIENIIRKDKKETTKNSDLLLIEEIEEIVFEEIDLLNSYSQNDTTRLTEISKLHSQYVIKDDSLEKDKLTLALLAETLRLNLIFFKQLIKNYQTNEDEYKAEYKKLYGELKEYIATYKIVKNKIELQAYKKGKSK